MSKTKTKEQLELKLKKLFYKRNGKKDIKRKRSFDVRIRALLNKLKEYADGE